MLRKRGYGICLLLTLWVCFATPATSGQLLTEEELDSMIASESSWSGVEVRVLVKGILEAAHKEIRDTAAEAVKEAVIPLQAHLAGERVRAERWEAAWRDEHQARIRAELLGKIGLAVGVGGALFGAGLALGAAAF